MNWVIGLSILAVFELIADYLAKEWSLNGVGWYAAGAFIAYSLANVFWLFALNSGSGLTRGAIIFSVSSAVLAVLLGVFLFKESLSYTQVIGVILGLISLIFIFWE